MTEAEVDQIVAEMKKLGLEPGQLAHRGWRTALRKATTAKIEPATKTESSGPIVRVHAEGLAHVRELVDPKTNPQLRGRQLEMVLFGVLQHERLNPERHVVIPGEEHDLAFVLDGQHYLTECKWEVSPIGLPAIHLLGAKVGKKAEGTFGVLLSMSGFVADVNEKASRGARLNCVGLVHTQLIAVLEGRTTWTNLVRKARQAASRRSLFWSE